MDDGIYSDNAGEYVIEVTQLVPAAPGVPEPASLALLGLGAAGLAGARLRRQAG